MVTIRKANINDVNRIVDIHLEAFENFFLTSLGREFLRFYYKCFINSSETVTLIAENDKGIVGFSASTSICRGFNSRLIKNNLIGFMLLSLKLLLTTPKSLIRLTSNLTKKSDSFNDDEDYAELYSIGVDPSFQKLGAGRKLISLTEEELKKMGVSKLSLTTDYDDNVDVISFYKGCGFNVLYEFVTYPQRKMYRFIKTL